MYLREISEKEFKNSNLPVLFENKLTDRMFGVISNDINSFKLGWQSNIIKPVVKEVNQEIYAIGIDQNFILIDLNLVNIRLKLELTYFFYNVVIYNNFIIVITELEIFIISEFTYKVVKEIPLPEIYTKMRVNERNIKFICVDGSEIDFDINKL